MTGVAGLRNKVVKAIKKNTRRPTICVTHRDLFAASIKNDTEMTMPPITPPGIIVWSNRTVIYRVMNNSASANASTSILFVR